MMKSISLGLDVQQDILLIPNGFCMENFPLILVRSCNSEKKLCYKVLDMKLGKCLEQSPPELNRYMLLGSHDSVESDS